MNGQREKESYHIYLILMFAGGLMGSYSYLLKGGVFANAETANCLLFGASIATGDFERARTLIIPITTYVIAAFFSEFMLEKMKDRHKVSWEAILVGFEAVMLFLLGFVPQSAPFVISHVVITFLGSMQYNTFRSIHNEAMATVFVTNHLRLTGVNAEKALTSKDKKYLMSCLYHLGMIATFMLGAGVMAVVSKSLIEKSIWIVSPVLLLVFFILLRDDLRKA